MTLGQLFLEDAKRAAMLNADVASSKGSMNGGPRRIRAPTPFASSSE
jgi:hypothetical protein